MAQEPERHSTAGINPSLRNEPHDDLAPTRSIAKTRSHLLLRYSFGRRCLYSVVRIRCCATLSIVLKASLAIFLVLPRECPERVFPTFSISSPQCSLQTLDSTTRGVPFRAVASDLPVSNLLTWLAIRMLGSRGPDYVGEETVGLR
jgi:hypothetical protein